MFTTARFHLSFFYLAKSTNFRVFGYISEAEYCKLDKLQEYVRKEKDEPTFFCSLCNDVRSEDQHLVLDHIEATHVKSWYECGECGIILPTRQITNAHKFKKHNSELMRIANSITSNFQKTATKSADEKQGQDIFIFLFCVLLST